MPDGRGDLVIRDWRGEMPVAFSLAAFVLVFLPGGLPWAYGLEYFLVSAAVLSIGALLAAAFAFPEYDPQMALVYPPEPGRSV